MALRLTFYGIDASNPTHYFKLVVQPSAALGFPAYQADTFAAMLQDELLVGLIGVAPTWISPTDSHSVASSNFAISPKNWHHL